jgi:hypothetical protein
MTIGAHSSCQHKEVSPMTTTAAAKRRVIAAASAIVALAVLAAPLPAAVAASDAAPQAAKTTSATAAKAPSSAKTSAKSSAAAADYTSIFAGQAPNLAGAGWAACAAPVTWSVDTRGLSEAEASAQIANIEWAFGQWAKAAGMSFSYAGTATLAYNDSAFTLKPADGSAAPSRHIYLAFVADADSDRMGGGVVGLGSPTTVWPSSKEIVNGAAVFRTDHIKKAGTREAKALYLHELGHVLGLGHAAEDANIMHGIVTADIELGAGDTNGVRSLAKPCTQAA